MDLLNHLKSMNLQGPDLDYNPDYFEYDDEEEYGAQGETLVFNHDPFANDGADIQ